MCDGAESSNPSCQKPESLQSTPQECTPEQIKSCHGDSGHPCVPREQAPPLKTVGGCGCGCSGS